MDATTNLDPRYLRGLLAEQQITHAEYARRCRLSRAYISLILCERARPGELARIKLARGLKALGLDRQAANA
jgi:transcriptional regulator with XRE-family HTH domain